MSKIDSLKIKNFQSWVITILIIANIIAAVFLSNRLYFRFDLTEGQKYSISKPTIDMLKKLDNTMIIEYYYNDKCKEHAQMAQIVQYIEDMLKEYENYSKGYVNVIVTQLSYEKNPDVIADLEKQGIQPFSLSERQEGESKTLLGFSGIFIKYKDQQKVLPAVYQDAGFEYTLDTEIKKLVDEKGSQIGVMVTDPNKKFNEHYKYISQITKKEYQNVRLLNKGDNIPNEIATLLIIGGIDLSEYDVFQIDQFLMNGGKAFIALNGVNVIMNPQFGIMGMPNDSKLFDLLDSYGITVNKDLVGDNDSYSPLPQRQGFFVQEYRYPIWPKIKSQNFTKDHPVVDELTGLNLFWPSSININDDIKENVTSLFHTTENSWLSQGNFKLDIDTYKYPLQQGQGSFDIAYSFKGKLQSFFIDKDIPNNEKGSDVFTGNKIDSGETQLVVVGNEHFLESNFMGENEILFLLNSLDWLSKDQTLIAIRNKGKFSRPLDKAKHKQQYSFFKSLIIIFTTYVIPLIFILIAIGLSILRHIKNEELKSFYSNKKQISSEGKK